MLSAVNHKLRQKILSAFLQTLVFVALGFVAYWLAFASQL